MHASEPWITPRNPVTVPEGDVDRCAPFFIDPFRMSVCTDYL